MNIYWKNPPVGNEFTTAGSWVQGVVPGSGDVAEVTHSSVIAFVSASSPVTVLGVNVGVGAEIVIKEGTDFTATEGTPAGAVNRGIIFVQDGRFSVGGTLNNPGIVEADPTGTLAVDGLDITVKGGGQVVLAGGDVFVAAGRTLSNVNNTIDGTGIISGAGTLVNQSGGFIQAVGGGQLALDIATRNQGTIEATALGGPNFLQINSSVINNTGGGVILAESNTAVLIGSDTSIIDGTVTAQSSGATVITGTNVTFDGGKSVVPTNTMITINGNVDLNPGAILNLKGTINNSGTISASDSATLVVQPSGTNSTVTFKGSGSIDLDVGATRITGGGSAVTLDNVNNKILGGGTIGGMGLKVKNEIGGTIDANSGTLLIDTGANTVTNAGALNAGSGTLVIASNLSNTGKLNANGGTIYAFGTVTGGTAIISDFGGNTGTVEFGAASTTATKFAAGTMGQLILADSAQYTGVISGFGSNTTQSIDLADFNFSGAQATSFSLGVLTLKNTAGQLVHLHFSGAHTLASFHLSDDGNFNGTDDGTKIIDPPAPTKPQIPLNSLASLFNQFIASWANPSAVLTSEIHAPLASELQMAINLLHAHW